MKVKALIIALSVFLPIFLFAAAKTASADIVELDTYWGNSASYITNDTQAVAWFNPDGSYKTSMPVSNTDALPDMYDTGDYTMVSWDGFPSACGYGTLDECLSSTADYGPHAFVYHFNQTQPTP